VRQVKSRDLHAVDACECLERRLGTACRNHHGGTSLREGPRGLQADARVPSRDQRQLAGEIDARKDIGGGGLVVEARVYGLLRSSHDSTLGVRARTKSSGILKK